MLTLFAGHGKFDLQVEVERSDLETDGHHLVEDTGILLGQAFARALGDKRGIRRYGTMYLPMDETLVRTVVDLSGRPFLVFDAHFTAPMCGGFDTQLTETFFRAFTFNAQANIHAAVLTRDGNTHHEIEALFKSLSRALRKAVTMDERETGIPSTKGVL
jgi:imidazoleglycerol-phosphate dehydratase